MKHELLEIKSLPPELQYRIWAAKQRREAIEGWACALLCAAMAATIVVRPLNEWLDKVIPMGPAPAHVQKAQTAKPIPTGSWYTPVQTGDVLGKGLVAGARGYNPRGAVNPITGQIRPHWGWDVGAPYGLPVYAVTQGQSATVECLYEAGGAGYYAVITPDTPDDTYFVSMHLAPGSCKPGKHKRGSIVGNVASTGASTGPHIHFEFRKKVGGVFKRLHPGRGQLMQHINGN